MNLTITQIITEIVTEVGGDTTDTTFAATMLVFLKSGMRKFPAFVKDRLLLVQEELPLALNAQTLALTGTTKGFLKENHIWYTTATGQRVPIIPPQSRDYFNQIYQTSSPGKPSYYIINGKTMQFDKKADEALTIGLEFFKEISDVTGSDTFFGDERTLEACKSLCKVGYYLDYEEDESKSARHERIASGIMLELESDYEDQEQAGHIGD